MQNLSNRVLQGIILLLAYCVLYISGCASIQHPTGGARDSVAPVILSENPKNFTTEFRNNQVVIEFDEYFVIKDEFKEVSISPAMEKAPILKTRKRELIIDFQESLQDSTTYTINFGKAIVDNNEGNVLKNYMYVFSTGPKIDSLSISGKVINTLTKEPVLDATAFILPLNQDTLFGKKRASIFTRTDSSGNFSLKYLRPDTYKIYALKEEGGDRIYNSTNELIAFKYDSIVLAKDTSEIQLELFKELPTVFRITDRKIEKDGRVNIIFNKELEAPSINILQPAELNATKMVEFSAKNDSAYLWTTSMEFDSLELVINDSNIALDTLVLRRNNRDKYERQLLLTDNISSTRLRPGNEIILTASGPIGAIDGKKFSLLQDSVAVNGLRVSRDSNSSRRLILRYPWREERQYSLSIGEAGLSGTYGGSNKAYTKEFTLDSEENYGVLSTITTVSDTTTNYILQVLNEKDGVLNSTQFRKTNTITFPLMPVGNYKIRVVYDENNNGKWDTGSVTEKRQPERVWNHPTTISLRANFEIEEKIQIPSLQ